MIFIKKEYALKIYKTFLTELRKRGLTMEEIVLWHLILDSHKLYSSCQYTNDELAEYLGVCKRSVQNYIAHLKNANLLKTTENPRNLIPCNLKNSNNKYKKYIGISKSELKKFVKEMNITSILLFVEICSISRKDDFCYAGNKYFLDLFIMDEKTLRKSLSELKKRHYIAIQNKKYSNNGKLSTKRTITPLK